MKIFPEITFHHFPKDRSLVEKVIRKFYIPEFARFRSIGGYEKYCRRMKKSFPVRWFISDSLPDFWHFKVKQPYYNVRAWYRYRFTEKYHIVKLDVKPGYMDPDDRILHVNFQILKDFVEIELGAMHDASEAKDNGKILGSFSKLYRKYKKKNIRNPEGGVQYLDWEIAESGSSHQAHAAAEKKAIYLWWTEERPNRLDVYDNPYMDNETNYRAMNRLESFYYEQDQEMLKRLIDIRSSIWM
jgi:hypothetical protein